MAIARSGMQIRETLGFLIYGKQGTRKSTLAADFLKMKNDKGEPMRVLYIDVETYSVDSYINQLIGDGEIDGRNLWLVQTTSMDEIIGLINKAKNNLDYYEYDDYGEEDCTKVVMDASGKPFRPDAIVIDSLTVAKIVLSQARLEFSEKRASVRATKNALTGAERQVAVEGADLEQKDYKAIDFAGKELITALKATGKHFAVIERAKTKKKYVLDKDGKQISVDMEGEGPETEEPDGFKTVEYEVLTVLHLYEETDGFDSRYRCKIEGKDRTRVYEQNQIIDDVHLTNWQCVIDRSSGFKKVNVVDDLRESVDQIKANEIEKITNNSKTDGLTPDKGVATPSLESLKQEMIERKNVLAKDMAARTKVSSEVKAAGLSLKIEGYTSVEELQKLSQVFKNNGF